MFAEHGCCRHAQYQRLARETRWECLPSACDGTVARARSVMVVAVLLVMAVLVAIGHTPPTAFVVVGGASITLAEILRGLTVIIAGIRAR
jgi:hypothetical protein